MADPAAPIDEAERRSGRSPLRVAAQASALLLVAALLGLLTWRLVSGSRGADLVNAVGAGRMPIAPAFRLPVIWSRSETWPRSLRPVLGEGTLAPAELRGHPVVLNIWASWCRPCAAEAPLLAASARAHAGRVAFLGVDVQDFKSDGRRFLRRFDVPFPSVRDSGSTYAAYGLTGVPETYWLDRRGRIVAHYAGQVSRRQLENGIRQAEQAR